MQNKPWVSTFPSRLRPPPPMVNPYFNWGAVCLPKAPGAKARAHDRLRALGPGAEDSRGEDFKDTKKHLPGNWEGNTWHHVFLEFLEGRSGSLCQRLHRDLARMGPEGEPHEATRRTLLSTEPTERQGQQLRVGEPRKCKPSDSCPWLLSHPH